MSHLYRVVGTGTAGPAGARSGAETVWWAGARFPRAPWASPRRLDLPDGGGQHCLHLGSREFLKQCVRKTGLPADTRNGMEPEAWSCEKEQEWRPGWDLNSWPGLWPGACGDQRHESRLAFLARGSSTWGKAAASLGRSS